MKRAWIMAAAVCCGTGCQRDNPNFAEGMTETEGDGSADADGTRTSSSSSSSSSDATGESSSGSSETTDPSGSETTVSVDDTGSETTTGGPPACMLPDPADLSVIVKDSEGNEIANCWGTGVLHGPVVEVGMGSWTIRHCPQSCANDCVGEEFELIIAGPPIAVPSGLPDCAHVDVEWFGLTYDNNDPNGCSWSGVVVRAAEGDQYFDPPQYIASQEVIDPPMAAPVELSVAAHDVKPCACEDPDLPGCCSMEPGRYDLQFDYEGVLPNPVTVEHAMSTMVMAGNDTWTIANVAALMSPVCDAIPDIRWAMLRE